MEEQSVWWTQFVEETGDKVVPGINGRNAWDVSLILLKYALALRMYGECAPGGHETWRAWETSTEHFLRQLGDM